MWKNRFGRGFGPVVWQITDDDDVMRILLLEGYKRADTLYWAVGSVGEGMGSGWWVNACSTHSPLKCTWEMSSN